MAKLLEITEELRRRWHQDIAEQGRCGFRRRRPPIPI